MDEARFTRLIDRLESYAQRNPGVYRLRVGLLTWTEGRSEKNYQALMNELSAAVQLSDFTVFAPLDDHQQYLEGILHKIPGAAVFSSADL